MRILATLLLVLTLLNVGLILWQWFVAWRFPLHRREATLANPPPVTLLKPLKGYDSETTGCLRSWFAQDYDGPVQILFGVAAADDPVCPIVRELMAGHPQTDAQLIISGKPRWPNAKVSTLVRLQPLARHEILIVSDADVRVPPDFLARLIGAFAGPNVGLVSCFYRNANPTTLAMEWEAFALNADFWSQVLQSRSLKPLDFALGAAMATTQRHLDAIGGFEVLADYLADDYELGNRIARLGARVELAAVVVDCLSPPMNWREVWAHQVRWARTIRVCQPLPYASSLVSNGTVWPLLCLLARPDTPAMVAALFCFSLRLVTAIYFQKKMTGRFFLRYLPVTPIKDLLQVVLWVLAFSGNRVNWRGEKLRALARGKLARG